MMGVTAGEMSWSIYLLAVVPSIAGWIALLPWVVGWAWPGPSLVLLGVLLLLSPLVDIAIARRTGAPPRWLRFRIVMASGLGLLTLAMAVV